MKTQDIYNAFHKEFNFLNEKGFKKCDKELIWRKKDYGFDAISILVSSYKPLYVVSFNLGIRINDLEDIFNKFSRTNPDYHQQTESIMVMHWEFSDELKKDYRIETPKELEDMKKDFESFMDNYGWDFFDKYNDLFIIDKITNTNPKEPCFLFSDKSHRAMYGLIVAKLLERENFNELVYIYRETLIDWNENYMVRYNKLVDYLK